MGSPVADRIALVVARRSSREAGAWLSAQLAAAPAQSAVEFATAFAAAGRRLGTAPLPLLGEEPALSLALDGRGQDEAARAALLLARLGTRGDDALVKDLFYKGGAREKAAVLRALPLATRPDRFLEVAVEAVRSSVQTIFEAIACENPYPADHFSDEAFNQLVLKALFTEARVARIVGLSRRAGPELARMVQGYADERRAAGRKVPEDLDAVRAFARRDR